MSRASGQRGDRDRSSEAHLPRAVSMLRDRMNPETRLGIQLGTGFASVAGHLSDLEKVPYASLPGFPRCRVPGHEGRLLLGRLGGRRVVVLSGRAHYYEGYSLAQITLPVRVLTALGVTTLLLTNAAGGIRSDLRPGDFMVVEDHINLMGENPLRGATTRGNRFVDLSAAYDPTLRRELIAAAASMQVRLHSGVYLAVAGPSYETPAEIRAFRRLGADAVGMSTVPEVIAARQGAVRVCALSCITNAAAGLGAGSLSHQEVLEVAARAGEVGGRLIEAFAARQTTGTDTSHDAVG